MRVAAIAALLLLAASVRAVELALDPQAVLEAIRVSQTGLDRERAALHAPYRLAVNRAPVDYIDVITPFRRVMLAAEQRRQLAERPISQREALELLATSSGIIDLVVDLTFNPLHTFVRVPDYEVRLLPPGGRPITPRNLDRVPRFGPRVAGTVVPLPGTPATTTGARTSQPMLGGTVIAAFDGFALDRNGTYQVMVTENGKDVAQTRLELKTLR